MRHFVDWLITMFTPIVALLEPFRRSGTTPISEFLVQAGASLAGALAGAYAVFRLEAWREQKKQDAAVPRRRSGFRIPWSLPAPAATSDTGYR